MRSEREDERGERRPRAESREARDAEGRRFGASAPAPGAPPRPHAAAALARCVSLPCCCVLLLLLLCCWGAEGRKRKQGQGRPGLGCRRR
jgi:hypothetical protein